MKSPSLTFAVVSTAIATLLLAGCSTRAEAPSPTAAGDAPEAEAAVETPATDVTTIDVCGWLSGEATIPEVLFGSLTSQNVGVDSPQRVLGYADGSQSVSCDLYGSSDLMPDGEIVGTVTLLSGTEIDSSVTPVDEPYSYRDIEGISVVGGSDGLGAARVAVQLEPGVVLSVEGFAPKSNTDFDTVGRLGVMPLMSRLLDAWVADKVPTVVDNSYADVSDFCADVDLTGLEELLVLEAGDSPATFASGGAFVYSSEGFTGEIECGYVSHDQTVAGGDQWPWNEPSTSGHPAVDVEITSFADAGVASDYLASHTSSGDSCSGAVATGTPASACEDGSGMPARRDARDNWVSFADLNGDVSAADEVAVALDAAATAMLDRATANPVVTTGDSDDPRRVPVEVTDTAPAGVTCDEGSAASGYWKTDSSDIVICLNDFGATNYHGSVDGVPFSFADDTCGPIDATTWGGPSNAFVCWEDLALTVSGGQDVSTTYVREYFTEKWANSAFSGGWG
jgi:hypothetical protein